MRVPAFLCAYQLFKKMSDSEQTRFTIGQKPFEHFKTSKPCSV
jgi:hypothetical protein